MLTTLGVLEEPLGNTRLHVARLVASLLYTSSASHAVVAQELCRLNTLNLLLVRKSAALLTIYLCWENITCLIPLWKIQDLFFKYTWNNFLHLQVELCVAAIVRPCAHEMRLQPGLVTQEKVKPHPDAAPEQELNETPTSELSDRSENSAHNLMVTHVSVSAYICEVEGLIYKNGQCGISFRINK